MNFGHSVVIFALILAFCPFHAQANCKCEQLTKFENGRKICYCRPGYVVKSNNPTKCRDIDECIDSNQTICEQTCNNTIGSYYCSCNEGYIISSTDPNKCKDDCCSRVANALPDLFEALDSYNGTKYYLSRRLSSADILMSQALCEIIGGYLLEIDDEAEYLFIKNYIERFTGFIMVYTGANDEVQNGAWVFRHSGKPVTFFAWTRDQPSNDAECMTLLYRFNDWRMDDYPCNDNRDDTRFLCEVPESPL